MSFKHRLFTFAKTFNPDAYESLAKEHSLKEAWRQFVFDFAVLFALMLILFVPAIFLAAPSLEAKLGQFTTLQLDANASAEQPIVLLEHPDVVVDLTGEEAFDTEEVLINKEGVTWKPWLLVGERSASWSELRDLRGLSTRTFISFFLFLLPSIAVWSGVFSFLFYLLVVLACAVLAWLLPKLWRNKITFPTALKLSLYAASVLMLQLIVLPFWRNWWLFPLLYVVFLAIGVALLGERQLTHDHESRKKGKRSRPHEIWD